MAATENTYTGDGSTTRFITFEYLQESDVKATVDDATSALLPMQIEFNATPGNNSKSVFSDKHR